MGYTVGVRWTEEMLQRLRDLADEGLTAKEVAEKMGVTRNSIAGKAARLKLEWKARKSGRHFAYERSTGQRPVRLPAWGTVREATQEIDKSTEPTGSPNIFTLKAHHCRWPMWNGDADVKDKLYCGAMAKWGSAYCHDHTEVAIQRYVSVVRPSGDLTATNLPAKSANSMTLWSINQTRRSAIKAL